MSFERETFFDLVREKPFGGSLTQDQVDGLEILLEVWERDYLDQDIRWLANALAQSFHETASTMQPVEEYGKGQGQPYGVRDPVTGQTYYGRGFVQITWRDNYARADKELCLTGDLSCEWHADNALLPDLAAEILFKGMRDGWFRSSGGTPNTFAKYFNAEQNDIFEAREIVNGDKSTIPNWSGGKSIGKLIEGYHNDFLAALDASWRSDIMPEPGPDIEIVLTIQAPPGVKVIVNLGDANA